MSESNYTETWISGPQSTQFYTRTYPSPSPRAILVFIHGFAEHVGRYTHIHPRFAQNGITLFTYDQRGFGKTALDEEHKSKSSAYGKTNGKDQLEDIEWAVNHVKKEYSGVPVFLMGHSMGGASVLTFATTSGPPPAKSTVDSLSGIIAGSPLIQQTKPASKLLRWVGGKVSLVAPYQLIPAAVNPDDLSHDPAANEAYKQDPLIKEYGSLRGVRDMLESGDQLLKTHYKSWPKSLPVLFVHGTEDKVTSAKATEEFYNKIPAEDKKLTLFPGGFHELPQEPDGVKEKVTDECIAFIHAHLKSSPEPEPVSSKM